MNAAPHRNFRRALQALPILLFITVLVFSAFTAWHYSGHILDSDASSELVLGKLLADQNKLITQDWIYSTELRVFAANLVYMPLFKLFDDWQAVRFISILIFQALMAGSYFYLSRRMKMSLHAFFLSASLMLLPLSVVYGRLGLFHNQYSPCFIYGFFIAGLYLSFLEHRGRKRLWQILRLAAMLSLAFISSLNGFRQLPSTMLPLFLTAFVTTLKEHRETSGTLADIPGQNWARTAWAGAVLVVGFAGLLIHTHVLSQYYQFRNMNTYAVSLQTMDNIRNLFVGYLSLFGFQEGRRLFSAEGILALGSAFAAVVMLFVSLQDIVPRKKPANFPGSFMGAFYPIAMLSMTMIFLIAQGNDNYLQYYLPAFVWIFPYLGLQADRMPASVKRISAKQALIILASLCMLINGVYTNLYYLNPDDKQVVYDPGIDVNTLEHLQGAIDFIQDNELEVGYAYFWDANVVTEATDGSVTMIPIEYDTEYHVLVYHDILTNLRYREEEFVEDKSVFVLATIAHSYYFGDTELAQYSILAYEDEYYRIYIFDFSTDVWEHLNQ